MKKALIILSFLLAGVALSPTISALEMGDITVTSEFGQPLNAAIQLISVSDDEKNSLVAKLSSPEVYKMKGIAYPQENDFHFQIESRANGEAYLKITSSQPINNSFVMLLIDFQWSSGQARRAYSFFLDKPQYLPIIPSQIENQLISSSVAPTNPVAVETAISAVSAVSSSDPNSAMVSRMSASAVHATESIAAASSAAAVSSIEPTASSSGDSISPPNTLTEASRVNSRNDTDFKIWVLVNRGDTLSKIADQYRYTNVSVERMLVAIYRINIDEFDDRNMNRIDEGKKLLFPTQDEIEKINQSDALKEIQAQVVGWHVLPHRLGGSTNIQKQHKVSEQVASGKIASSTDDKTSIKSKPVNEIIKISKGEKTEDQINPKLDSLPEKNQGTENQEDAIAKRKKLAEEERRAAALNNNLQAMEKLQEITSQVAVQVKQPASSVEQIPSKQGSIFRSLPWKLLIIVSLLGLLAVFGWIRFKKIVLLPDHLFKA